MSTQSITSSENLGARKVYEDYISSLPDDVISHILSSLPTEDAVKTSVLSQQWKNKYTSVYAVDIFIDHRLLTLNNLGKCPSLDLFMNKLLSQDGSTITSFRLSIECNHDLVVKWVHQILSHNIVQNLVIFSYCYGSGILSSVRFVVCTSLLTLKFWSRRTRTVQFSSETCLPNLKILHLYGVRNHPLEILIEQTYKTEQLSLIFPVLEDLVILYCQFLKGKVVEINVPRLIKFEYHSTDRQDCDFVLNAPELKYITLIMSHSNKCNALGVQALLKGFKSLEVLKLSWEVVKALLRWKAHVVFAFDRIRRLELFCHPRDLLGLIEMVPCLESLKIDMRRWYKYKHVEHLPLCIAPNLKQVELINFSKGSTSINFVKLFLENAEKLERVIVCLRKKSMAKTEMRSLELTLNSMSSSCAVTLKSYAAGQSF